MSLASRKEKYRVSLSMSKTGITARLIGVGFEMKLTLRPAYFNLEDLVMKMIRPEHSSYSADSKRVLRFCQLVVKEMGTKHWFPGSRRLSQGQYALVN